MNEGTVTASNRLAKLYFDGIRKYSLYKNITLFR